MVFKEGRGHVFKRGQPSKEKRLWVRIIDNAGEEKRTFIVVDGDEEAKVPQHELNVVPNSSGPSKGWLTTFSFRPSCGISLVLKGRKEKRKSMKWYTRKKEKVHTRNLIHLR